ncbi:MAG: T9SS type A sorting domain-containing protein [Bacteroidota bacterium]
MNRKFYKFLFILPLLCAVFALQAQTRYLDQVFSGSMVTNNVKYATNISVLTGSAESQDLLMDVYQPMGDTLDDRPVIVYFHTGSFLPPLFNGGITGSRTDSTVVNVCKRMNELGYVAIAATYRAGWNPAATGPAGQNIRTGTLLNAAYRGIQDARSLIRFLRKSVAEEDNPYGIDPDKIVLWGQGTGGYISLGAAFLDRFSEVNIDKFIDTETLLPYVDTALVGGVFGLENRPLSVANHPGYSSDFAMAVNMGGALGDESWIDGSGNEPPTIGFHVVKDPFAPFSAGPVIVPTTGDFVVNVIGTRAVVEKSNDTGVNSVLAPANGLTNTLNAIVSAYENVPVIFPSDTTTLATENMYPFLTPGLESGPWDWWDKPTLDALVAGTNQVLNTDFNSDTLHNNGLLTNPGMSIEKATPYLDTIIAYYIPRGCIALELTECLDALGIVSNINPVEVGLSIQPNPASEFVQLRTDLSAIRHIRLYDMSGRLVQEVRNINEFNYDLYRNDLPPGVYAVQLHFDEGILAKKIVFK